MSRQKVDQVRIREAKAGDLPAILDLYRQLIAGDDSEISLEQAEKLFLRIGNYPDYRIYLAERETGQPVGTFALLIMDSLGHRGTPAAVLEDVVVSAADRGSGIGQQMMAFATETARGKGCKKFFFSSGINRSDAHQFYENLGFRQHGYSYYLNL
ncbi:GNAT family N-acetyltransferase [uncultured Desulfuromusa sp.]|uniref:GNAT family N-acetyltransferase n=1 Tax=uncultured Desulfuromusa sp. TaxID=219183 RepID=UPI002AA7A0D5|nr:GNAT family N-acetyltransferase [uncultured Desulfuromusa sp.]